MKCILLAFAILLVRHPCVVVPVEALASNWIKRSCLEFKVILVELVLHSVDGYCSSKTNIEPIVELEGATIHPHVNISQL